MNLFQLQLRNQKKIYRGNVCFCLHIDNTRVRDVFPESLPNTDTRLIWTLWHISLVSVLTGLSSVLLRSFSEPPPPPSKISLPLTLVACCLRGRTPFWLWFEPPERSLLSQALSPEESLPQASLIFRI